MRSSRSYTLHPCFGAARKAVKEDRHRAVGSDVARVADVVAYAPRMQRLAYCEANFVPEFAPASAVATGESTSMAASQPARLFFDCSRGGQWRSHQRREESLWKAPPRKSRRGVMPEASCFRHGGGVHGASATAAARTAAAIIDRRPRLRVSSFYRFIYSYHISCIIARKGLTYLPTPRVERRQGRRPAYLPFLL